MRERRREFPEEIKKDVKVSQDWRCGYCNGPCRGHGYSEPRLEVHHIVPQSVGGPPTRENAVGLCGHGGDCNCHESFDQLYFKTGKTFVDVMLEEGRIFDLKRLGLMPPGGSRRSISRVEKPKDAPYIPQSQTGDFMTSENVVFYDEGAGEKRGGAGKE